MRLDAVLPTAALSAIPALARSAESAGFAALWTNETQHDAFLPHPLIAEHTQTLGHGTAVAIAFARSPGALAYTAWDLAAASGGRFMLGLGTQVRPHIERRFGLSWPEQPVGTLRELVGALRAFWHAWQTGERLNFRGKHYRLTLMTPFFNPGPIDHPDIPIYLAGVNTGLSMLAGEVAQGFHAHPLHSADYLAQVVKPAIATGASKAGRDASEIQLTVTAFIVTDAAQADRVRSEIAFYASTPTYRPVLALHGWGDTADALNALSRRGAWEDMPGLIDDAMLATVAVVAAPEDLAGALKARYEGVANRLMLYRAFAPDEADSFWVPLLEEMEAP
jgi:probable F420-dependent oxidoreductase